MANATIAQKYVSVPRTAWTGIEKIPLDVSGADGVGLASTLRTYVNAVNRIRLTAKVSYYVTTAGNDTTGDGSVGNPWASPQKAYDYICDNLDLAGWKVTVNIAAGTYQPVGINTTVLDLTTREPPHFDTSGKGSVGIGTIEFLGQSDRTLVKLESIYPGNSALWGYFARYGTRLKFTNLQLIQTPADYPVVWLEMGGQFVQFTNVDVSGGGGGYYQGQFFLIGVNVQFLGEMSILSGTPHGYFISASSSSYIEIYADIHVPSPVTFADGGFIFSQDGAQVGLFGTNLFDIGNFTGNKFEVYAGSVSCHGFTLAQIYGQATLFGWGNISSYKSDDGRTRGAVFPIEFKTGIVDLSDLVEDAWAIFQDEETLDYTMIVNVGNTEVRTLIRAKLFANRTYYVRSGGSDSHAGLVDDDAHAWGTLAHAVDVVANKLDLGPYTVVVKVNSVTSVTYLGNNSGQVATTPSTTVLTPGAWGFYKDNANSKIYVCYNDGGAIKTLDMDVAAPVNVTNTRTQLTGNATYYINFGTGNDSTGTGLVGAPWKTPQKAYTWIATNVDFNGFNVTVNCAAGTYTSASGPNLNITYPWVGGGQLIFNGQANRTLVKFSNINGDFVILAGTGPTQSPWCSLVLQNIQFGIDSPDAGCTHLDSELFVYCRGCDVTGTTDDTGSLFYAAERSMLWLDGPFSILSGTTGGAFLYASGTARIDVSGNIAIPAPVNVWSDGGFARAYNGGNIQLGTAVFDNPTNVIGPKFMNDAGGGRILLGNQVCPGTVAPNNFGGILTHSPTQGPGGGTTFTESHGGIYDVVGLPTTTQLPYINSSAMFRNTSNGKIYMACNDGGTIKTVELT